MIDAGRMIETIKKHPDYHKAGMILVHNGVVRNSSRNGRAVERLIVEPDRERLVRILAMMKKKPGIIEISAEVSEGELKPGDDIMVVAVAGDIREHVFPVLQETIALIKKDVTKKTER